MQAKVRPSAFDCKPLSLKRRCCLRDLETAWEAVRLAKRPRVHTFLATSQIHMEHKLKMTPDQASLDFICHM